MRKVTLLLFQLFIGIFIIYAMLYDFPKGILLVRLYQDLILSLYKNLLVSFLCLVCMFLIEKLKKAPDRVIDIPTYRKPKLSSVVVNSKRGQLHKGKENREHARRSVSIPVEFTVQSNLYRGLAYNISDGGIFIGVTGPFTVGQEIAIISPADQVSLRSAEKNRPGSIVWISPHGIGVKFEKP